MTPGISPLALGFAAVVLLLIPIALVFSFRRTLERWRMRPRRETAPARAGGTTTQEWMYRSRARDRAMFQFVADDSDTSRSGPADGNRDAARNHTRPEPHELVAQAEREAAAIVAAACAKRAEILTELAHDCAVVEETRRELSRLLTEVLEEIDRGAVGAPNGNVHQLGEARGMRTAASADL